MQDDALRNAYEELKRVDHLIYVSLKYTRTCDVLHNVVKRHITCFDCIFDGFLEQAEQENKIFEVPNAPVMKANEFKKLYEGDTIIAEFVAFYLHLRKINRTEYTKSNEFRRYVTMHMTVDDEECNIDIDLVTEYYKKAKEYIEHIRKQVKG